MAKKRLILGIDLGTTNSLACLQVGAQRFEYFSPKGDGQVLMPSVFFHQGDNKFAIGADAELEEQLGRRDVIRHVKRFMKFNYDFGNGKPREFKSNGKKFVPSQIAGEYLRTLKKAAERDFANAQPGNFHEEFDFRGQIDQAVITVPAYFGPQERQATKDAAVHAGFGETQLLDEPVAAAIGMGLHEKPGKQVALIIDLGGGTCDISLLKVGQTVSGGGFEELGRIGDNDVGGINFDREIVQRTLFSNPPTGYSDLQLSEMLESSTQGRLYGSAERAKIYLCDSVRKTKQSVSAHVAWLEPTKEKTFETDVSLKWFLEFTDYLIEYIAQMCDALLTNIDRKEAGLKRNGVGIRWSDVDAIYLVGGGARMPQLQDRITKRWNSGKKIRIADRPQWVVAEGAAAYAAMRGRGVELPGIAMPRCPYDIGVMYRPQPTFWERVRQKIRRTPQEKTPLQFGALIHSNSLLGGDEDSAQTYVARVTDQNARKVCITICQRAVDRNANGTRNGSTTDEKPKQNADDNRTHQVKYQVKPLRNLMIVNLPRGRRASDDQIEIEVRCNADHTMQFEAWYQGRKLPEVVIRQDEVNRFSDLVWDASTGSIGTG